MVTFEIEAESLRRGRVQLDRLDHTELPAAMVQTAHVAANRLIRLLTQPTMGWSSQPSFERALRVNSRGAEVRVTTSDKRWLWTNFGTRPHTIRPKGQGYPLRFMSGYSPATRPGSLTPYQAKSFGAEVYRYEVHHPGTLARRFDVEAIKGTDAAILNIARNQVQTVLRDR